MATCPDGHDSTMDDYCSSCGLAMGASSSDSSGTPTPAGATGAGNVDANGSGCPNCSEVHAESAVFCENCGYDFLAGSMPGALSDPDPAVAGPSAALSAAENSAAENSAAENSVAQADGGATGWHLVVSADRSYFDRMSAEGQLDFPDPPPTETTVALTFDKALLGRRSESRGVFPEVDVLALTGDPAVSTRHAMLEKQSDGSYSLTDLSSTNGTSIGDAETTITAGVAAHLADGDVVFLGAWTRLELRFS